MPGARPARRDVPQGADGPSHPPGVRRTVAGCTSCHHSHRIGEVTNSCARWTLVASLLQGRGSSEDGLPGCPTRKAMEAQTARRLHPQDLGQGRVATEAAGLTQRWTEPSAGNPLRKVAHLSRDSLSVTIRFMCYICFYCMPGRLVDKQVCCRRRGECERLGVPPSLTTSSESVCMSCPVCHPLILSRVCVTTCVTFFLDCIISPLFVYKRS